MSRRFRENPKSEMDSQRDLLDTLMGVNRNMDRAEDEINDYHDDRVCKFFLSSVCSHGKQHIFLLFRFEDSCGFYVCSCDMLSPIISTI